MIISLTSYPKRIYCCEKVIASLISQQVNVPYKVCLVLCEKEFENKENDLPPLLKQTIDMNIIDVIWINRNIMSHKKLMPVLKKYPNEDILITDDDIIRPQGWVQQFVDDHQKYPNDIICGTFMYTLKSRMYFERLDGPKGKHCKEYNSIPNIVFDFCRPANGCGGVYYPSGTFTDERFFDEDLMMELSPTSDESWQYIFNIIEGRTFRQTSVVYDNSEYIIPDSQKSGLYKINNYDIIFKRLIDVFPEFETQITNRQKGKFIVSVASYKERLISKTLDKTIDSIFKQTIKPYKIVLTLYNNDVVFLSDYMRKLINDNKIELIIDTYNLKSHNKYFHVMKKYNTFPIITIDDDIIYTTDMIESLYKGYQRHPNCVICRRCHTIIKNDEFVTKYKNIEYEQDRIFEPTHKCLITTGGGTLYPPNILDINDSILNIIYNFISVDDFVIKKIMMDKGIKSVYVKNNNKLGIKNNGNDGTALYKKNNTSVSYNDFALNTLFVNNIKK